MSRGKRNSWRDGEGVDHWYCFRGFSIVGARGSVLVEALCCKLEGRGIESRRGGLFQLT
jgi:hypothetical protein